MEEKKEIITEDVPVADTAAETDSSQDLQPDTVPDGENTGESSGTQFPSVEDTSEGADVSGAVSDVSDPELGGTDSDGLDTEGTETTTEETSTNIPEEETKEDTSTEKESETEGEGETETVSDEVSGVTEVIQNITYETEAVVEVPFLEKPLAEYTTTEGLLLLLFLLGLVAFVYDLIFN